MIFICFSFISCFLKFFCFYFTYPCCISDIPRIILWFFLHCKSHSSSTSTFPRDRSPYRWCHLCLCSLNLAFYDCKLSLHCNWLVVIEMWCLASCRFLSEWILLSLAQQLPGLEQTFFFSLILIRSLLYFQDSFFQVMIANWIPWEVSTLACLLLKKLVEGPQGFTNYDGLC